MRAPRDRRVTRGRELARRAWRVGSDDHGGGGDPHEQQCRNSSKSFGGTAMVVLPQARHAFDRVTP